MVTTSRYRKADASARSLGPAPRPADLAPARSRPPPPAAAPLRRARPTCRRDADPAHQHLRDVRRGLPQPDGARRRPRRRLSGPRPRPTTSSLIYGETGLGKTHLMHAIPGTRSSTRTPRPPGVPTSRPRSSPTSSSRPSRRTALTQFRQRYRHADDISCSTTSAVSSPARSASRRSSSAPSTTSSRPARQIVLSSDPARQARSRSSSPAWSPASSGACRPTSRRPTSGARVGHPCRNKAVSLEVRRPAGGPHHHLHHAQNLSPAMSAASRRRVHPGGEPCRALQQAPRCPDGQAAAA